MSKVELGELLYEYEVKLGEMTEYGFDLGAFMAGQTLPPAEGARFDAPFEGNSIGPKLKGKIVGVDHLRLRADGRMDLHIHATITTVDGHNVALYADGVCLPRPDSSVAELRENVTLFTSAKEYAWVNTLQIWGIGAVDLAVHQVHIKGYAA